MGYFGKLELKEKALELRKKGLSYNEIHKTVPVSKDTLSRWCKNIQLTDVQKLRLIAKKEDGQKKGSIIAAQRKKQLKNEKIKNIHLNAKKELGTITKRDEFIFGIALYAGEGGKTDGKGAFTNTDPYFISFMCRWLNKYCGLQINNIKAAIWIHEENDEDAAKIYWSRITGIPLINFHKSYIVKRKEKIPYRKNIHPYGVISIRFYNSDMQRKIIGWISTFLSDKIADTQGIEYDPL